MESEFVLELKNITKTYPGVVALNDVSIGFKPGEIHALLGENGAGKSTLIKAISGAIVPDSGQIIVDGKQYAQLTPHISRSLGIGAIYQEFNLVPYLSAAENIFLGNPIRNGIQINMKEMVNRSKELFKSLNIDLNPLTPVKELTVAYQQIVEIAKAVSQNVKVLIMDEPSAPLTNNEVVAMFELVKRLKERGVTIIYISHRLEELFEISDRVTVMRDGQYIDTKNTRETSRKELISLMVGRELTESYPSKNIEPGEIALEVRNLSGNGVRNISFAVKKGEILGFSGLVGSGRTELVRAIFGADPIESGEIFLEGKKVTIKSPSDAIQLGIGLIPEDRKQQGVILGMSVKENISFAHIRRITSLTIINRKKENDLVSKFKDSLSIKTPTLSQKVKNLSGGNQQKVVLAKWLATNSKVLIFDEPTRGIDVGAKQEIYKLMCRLAEEGKAIIMISSEMPELLGMADRITVICEGRIVGELGKGEATQDGILDLASGSR